MSVICTCPCCGVSGPFSEFHQPSPRARLAPPLTSDVQRRCALAYYHTHRLTINAKRRQVTKLKRLKRKKEADDLKRQGDNRFSDRSILYTELEDIVRKSRR